MSERKFDEKLSIGIVNVVDNLIQNSIPGLEDKIVAGTIDAIRKHRIEDLEKLYTAFDEVHPYAVQRYKSQFLLYAVSLEFQEGFDFYLKKEANINHIDDYGNTPLTWAVKFNKTSNLLKQLLDLNVNIHHTDNEGMSALMYACRKGNFEFVNLIMSNLETKFLYIKEHISLNKTKELFEGIAEYVNLKDNLKMTALKYAVQSDNIDIVKLLLKYNKEPISNLLKLATNYESSSIVGYLLEHIETEKIELSNILIKACRIGNLEILLKLKERYPTTLKEVIDFKDNMGNTAIFYAVLHQNIELINTLLDFARPDLFIRNKDGHTIYSLVQNMGLPEIELLDKYINDRYQGKDVKQFLEFKAPDPLNIFSDSPSKKDKNLEIFF